MANELQEQLVLAKELREMVWSEKSRPSIQWIRAHTGVDIPGVRIGRLIWYSPKRVKAALNLS